MLNSGKDNAILYFGGNGEAVVYNSLEFAETFPEYTLYLVNYRGYGGSSGKSTEKALYFDAHTIYDVIEKRHAKVSVIGRSLGSAIATFLASTRVIYQILINII